ncbi:translation initiation factor IF-3 [Salipaludibacillus daqingensis]|uniref:translation initiation factor IF-3 n=1 Tax=Salipaludibacillus daqingensis TaxID=3041001 RepID=UPI002476D0E8|nr:translation initiation factor IF-3 [Salipaludibacillus daqingensis]
MIKNNKIKAEEVHLTGLDGEDLGILQTSEALAMAKENKVDLICTSLMSNPPPAKLIASSAAKNEKQKAQKKARKPKLKEIRLTPFIEEHDYDTKKRRAENILQSGDSVYFVVKGKGTDQSKELLANLLNDLSHVGTKKTGIQISGKQSIVQVDPV